MLTTTYWRWSAGVQLARLPTAMAPLAFTSLTTAATGSYRLGGVLMAVYVVAEMAGAVPVGRVLDRVGAARGLRVLLVLVAAGTVGLALAAAGGASGPVLLALVVLPGLAGGGLSGGFRSLLATVVRPDQLTRAIAVMAAAGAGAAVLVPKRTAKRATTRAKVPLAACLPWLACQFTVGLLLSTIEVAPLPLVQRLGAPAAAAPVVVAVLCGASITGSAVYAWRGRGGPRLFLTAFIAGGALVAADLGWPGLLAGVVLVGAVTGPLVTIASVHIQRLLPENRRSEGFSVSFTVQSCGYGLGSLAVGVLPLWLAPLLGVVVSTATIVLLFPRGGRRCDADAESRATIGTASATS
ncbi:MFS transporter [Amycolatopsis sp. NPDC051903]|uniref:MFS transporter n=1 Tax=Amycolatopsis sp. NPDC051903 TaxID=3363936 RepID=UPI00379264C5